MGQSNGTALNFGYTGGDGITITGISGTLLQSADHSVEADKEETRTGQGDIVNRFWYDQHSKASIEWVVKGTGLANAIVNSTLAALTPGTILVVSACASDPDLVATTWEVQRASLKGSNTTSKRITCEVEKRAGITAASTA